MDRADYALKLMAEGKLNLSIANNKNLEIEQMKLKNFKNNIIILDNIYHNICNLRIS